MSCTGQRISTDYFGLGGWNLTKEDLHHELIEDCPRGAGPEDNTS